MTDRNTEQRVNVDITGMSCGHCVTAVKGALANLPGVTVREVAIGSAAVSLSPDGADTEAVLEALRDAGYDASIAS